MGVLCATAENGVLTKSTAVKLKAFRHTCRSVIQLQTRHDTNRLSDDDLTKQIVIVKLSPCNAAAAAAADDVDNTSEADASVPPHLVLCSDESRHELTGTPFRGPRGHRRKRSGAQQGVSVRAGTVVPGPR